MAIPWSISPIDPATLGLGAGALVVGSVALALLVTPRARKAGSPAPPPLTDTPTEDLPPRAAPDELLSRIAHLSDDQVAWIARPGEEDQPYWKQLRAEWTRLRSARRLRSVLRSRPPGQHAVALSTLRSAAERVSPRQRGQLVSVLWEAYSALELADRLAADDILVLYAPLEPVIPLATLRPEQNASGGPG